MTELLVASGDVGHRLAVLDKGSADAAALAPLAHDESWRIRRRYALPLTDFGRSVPPGVAEAMAVDPEPVVRRSLLFDPGPAALLQDVLVDDPDPVVRALMAKPDVWELLAGPVRENCGPTPARRSAGRWPPWTPVRNRSPNGNGIGNRNPYRRRSRSASRTPTPCG
ncbi:hypothetical protein ACFY7H_00365 [Streptomyces sp. NPDC012794]|uniref:hypothetical protein n=1 Tax=Streptomyces sp. NPDC012794 TaxID=3364850 RepID=UPI003683A88F